MAPTAAALRRPPPATVQHLVPRAPIRWVRLRFVRRVRRTRPWWLLHLVEIVTYPCSKELQWVVG